MCKSSDLISFQYLWEVITQDIIGTILWQVMVYCYFDKRLQKYTSYQVLKLVIKIIFMINPRRGCTTSNIVQDSPALYSLQSNLSACLCGLFLRARMFCDLLNMWNSRKFREQFFSIRCVRLRIQTLYGLWKWRSCWILFLRRIFAERRIQLKVKK